ncbi:hypothetical protein V5G65_03645 [Mammaliicoccus sciuri]|uniref:hypothetical protein n=1 Tax=Mammaliicoccus sciuri TaxID=1296 RepID=UPI0037963C0F
MIYVIDDFKCKEDKHIYRKGMLYPFNNRELSHERVSEITTDNNSRNKAVAVIVDEKMTKKELLSIARIVGIDVDEKSTKADILNAFE